MLNAGEPRSLAVFEDSNYVFPQLGLILLDRRNVVRAPLDCLARCLLRQPMASMVTARPLISGVFSSLEMAVISLECASVLTCPSATPLAVAHASGIWMGDSPFALSAKRRTVLQSIAATCPCAASQIRFVHSMKMSWKFRAPMSEKTRPNVSWEGIPLGSSRNVSNRSSLAFPKDSISTRLSAQAVTARVAPAMTSPSLALYGALHSRVIDAGEAVDDGYGYGLRLFTMRRFPWRGLSQF